MSDTPVPAPSPSTPDYKKHVKLQYIGLLLGTLFFPLAFISVICAHVFRTDMPQLESAHARHQIRTFWFGLLWSLISLALMVVVIGFFTGFITFVWVVVRYVKGLMALEDGRYPANYTPRSVEVSFDREKTAE